MRCGILRCGVSRRGKVRCKAFPDLKFIQSQMQAPLNCMLSARFLLQTGRPAQTRTIPKSLPPPFPYSALETTMCLRSMQVLFRHRIAIGRPSGDFSHCGLQISPTVKAHRRIFLLTFILIPCRSTFSEIFSLNIGDFNVVESKGVQTAPVLARSI